jgi:hypothetical protein
MPDLQAYNIDKTNLILKGHTTNKQSAMYSVMELKWSHAVKQSRLHLK